MSEEKPKKARAKRRRGGIPGATYKRSASPRARAKPWLTVIIRAEHYAMLRELGKYYRVPIGKMASSLILNRFLTLLRESDPQAAKQLEEEHRSDEDISDILDLGR